MNDGRIQHPSNPFGIVPLSRFVPRGFGFVYHSIAILYHEVPNLSVTIRNFFIAVGEVVSTNWTRRFQAPRGTHRLAALTLPAEDGETPTGRHAPGLCFFPGVTVYL